MVLSNLRLTDYYEAYQMAVQMFAEVGGVNS